MKNAVAVALLGGVLLAASGAQAQTAAPADLAVKATEAYAEENMSAFETIIVQAIEAQNKADFASPLQTLKGVRASFGKYELTDVVWDKLYGTSFQNVVTHIVTEKTQVFLAWRFYKNKAGWWLRGMDLQTDTKKAMEFMR